MMDRFFSHGIGPDPLLWQQHDPWLVLLSVLVSIGASAVALHLAALARVAATSGERRLALASGALALCSGVWTMHYVGMLAFAACGQARFDLGMTVASILPSLAASWVALRLLVREQVGLARLWGSGLLVGAGIGAMHYIGMAASELAPLMRYDVRGFALSIVVAVLLAVLALWVRFGLRRHLRWRTVWVNLLSGCVMGLSIAGMHYTGMGALRFVESIADIDRVAYALPLQTSLALAVVAVTVALAMVALAVNASLRYRTLLLQVQRAESRQRAIADTAVDGIVTLDGRGVVQSLNRAAERLLGWPAYAVVGRSMNMFVPPADQAAHHAYLQQMLAGGEFGPMDCGRELQLLRSDDTLITVRLALGRVQQQGDPLLVGFLVDLTAIKALERERQRDQARLQTLVGNLPGVAFRSQNQAPWAMVYVSEQVDPLTGWSVADFLAVQVTFEQLIHPDDLDHVWQEVDYALRHDRPYAIEYRIRTRDGRTRWLSEYGRGVADEDGVVRWIDGVMLDTTEAKARNAEFAGTVAALNRSQSVAEFDLQGHLLYANANYLALMGYVHDEVIGVAHHHFCPPEFANSAGYAAFWQSLVQGQFQSGEYERVGQGGRAVWLHATYNPIFDAEGKAFKVIKFATDLSTRRAMEQDLREAKDRAESAAAARASFLANMSHEIRTPMNAIIGFSEALLDTPLSSTQQRHLGTVHGAARSLLRLLNDILDTAKLDKGAMALEERDFSLRELCQQTLDTLRINAHRKGLPLLLDYPEAEPDHLRGDALRLQQILLNLLGNAIKFTEQGQVRLQVRYAASHLLLKVQDTGIGMSAEQLARIFDPFAQADASTTRRFGGTGLGTTIARQLAELMGGSIAVQSQPGAGTCFDLCLPLPLGQAPDLAPQPASVVLAPLHILAVDDVPANLELLEVALSRGGHRLTLASDGAQAVRYCSEQRFDLVLMDLHMPGMDGLQATRLIRAHESAQALARQPIIALSASVLEEDQGQARDAGMDGFACKPLDLPRLQAEIARALGLVPAAAADGSGQPSTAPASQEPIDWQSALALWGQAGPLHQALKRLVSEHPELPQELQALQSDHDALRQLAHRLRGAAGNLGLGPLQHALALLEGAARAQDTTAIQEQLTALPALWTALLQALPAALQGEQLTPPEQPQPFTQPPQIHTAIAQALAALQRGELPDAALGVLAQHVPKTQLQPLRQALAGFDFDRAQQLLQQLRTTLEPA